MSTKIYNGYILDIHNFVELRHKLKELQAPMEQIKIDHLHRMMNRMLITEMDKLQFDETRKPKTLADVKSEIKNKVWEEILKSERSAQRNWPWDVNADVTIIPIEREKTLALFFAHIKEHTELWDKQPWVRDYHFQNQTDWPEGMTAEVWAQREKDWDRALPGAGVPAIEGFNFVLCEQKYFYNKWEPDFAVAGTPIERARFYAEERVRDEWMRRKWRTEHGEDKRPDVSEIMETHRSGNDYLKTEEGKHAVDTLAFELQSKIRETYN